LPIAEPVLGVGTSFSAKSILSISPVSISKFFSALPSSLLSSCIHSLTLLLLLLIFAFKNLLLTSFFFSTILFGAQVIILPP
jgi:hypothetical protein